MTTPNIFVNVLCLYAKHTITIQVLGEMFRLLSKVIRKTDKKAYLCIGKSDI